MEKGKLIELVTKFGIPVEELKYDYGFFMTEEITTELCPNCDRETDIKSDGTSDCTNCGHNKILPCSQCPLADNASCDWGKSTGCTPFPKN